MRPQATKGRTDNNTFLLISVLSVQTLLYTFSWWRDLSICHLIRSAQYCLGLISDYGRNVDGRKHTYWHHGGQKFECLRETWGYIMWRQIRGCSSRQLAFTNRRYHKAPTPTDSTSKRSTPHFSVTVIHHTESLRMRCLSFPPTWGTLEGIHVHVLRPPHTSETLGKQKVFQSSSNVWSNF